MSLKKKIVSIAAVGACALAGTALVPAGPAFAVPGGNFTATITVNSDMSANGYVGDTAFGGTYRAILVAAGYVACGLIGPQTAVTGLGADVNNPAQPSTPGTCTPVSGEVTYLMTWVSTLGVSGSLPVQCEIVLSRLTCSPHRAAANIP